MKDLIEKIIKNNSPDVASERILKLIEKNQTKDSFSIDDLRKAFEGGRDSVDAVIKYYHFGDMEEYASKEIVKSFKQYMHETYHYK